ncbi:HlyD family secretion protein [Sphingomonas sp. YR710]|uniref:efflux RND transporter periplasmic adaptor subunit n=1 Tax=Sphingomonas sp. YR710 TaxID=1882773 RepID=UPI0008898DAA|nr:HlyD family efflux transporter periplasmic adaptor subunit [Sphingomonas sp. YR710]SDD80950.1 HlyD family secretion protein [Sphingomonas sp. YR710]
MAVRIVTGPRIIGALIVLVLAAALFFAMRTPKVDVDAGRVTRGPLAVTVNDLAETRVRDLYMVAAPITGELLRVPLKPGARVVAGETLLARIQPPEPGAIDARTLAQIHANIRALEAQAAAARAQAQEAVSALDFAERQLGRTVTLNERGFLTQAALDQARSVHDRARAAVRAANGVELAARESVRAARAGLITGGQTHGHGITDVRAPVSGFVLTVPQESERVVTAGTPLLAIGDADRLEMVTDLLSSDAVQVHPGAAVSIEDWGGERPLHGRVRLVEPYGYLKVSALGVEEQRVNVVIDFTDERAAWAGLGHGFRATVRITTWSVADAVRVPVGALFRRGDAWHLFRISKEGRAEEVEIRVGRMSDEWAQILGGVSPGDIVILHPSDKVAVGVRVRARSAG